MTFNGVVALILRYFRISPNSIALQAEYVTVFEDRYNARKVSSHNYIWPPKTDTRNSHTASL